MKKPIARFGLLALVTAAAVAGCSNDPTVNTTTTTTGSTINFIQIDRVGRPGLKELYLPYAQHDPFNRQGPLSDMSTTAPLINTFVTGAPASRSAAISAYIQALLTPDALVANLANTSTRASYLGWETGGAIKGDCTGLAPTPWGGRALNDDVVNAMLGLAFGNLATTANPTPSSTPAGATVSPAPDDGNESNGTGGKPNLTNQMVSCAGKNFQPGTFPYLAPPV